jgi:tRNA threonylcarbamoyladenosine biosynthesis protein TsaB
MAIILSIETSTITSSIAIHEDGTLLVSQHIHLIKSHSEYLVPTINHLLEVCGIKATDLHAIAVSKGPGSYTGLRIGTATAKGLCYGLDTKLIAINTLEAMAFGLGGLIPEDALFCPMIDARRMEVYCMVLGKKLNVLQPTKALVIDKNSFAEYLSDQSMVFFGNGAAKCKETLSHQPNALFLDGIHPNAEHIGALAWKQYQLQIFEDVAIFEPFYLKDFIAKKPLVSPLV